MKKHIFLCVVAFMLGTTLTFAQGVRNDRHDIRHDNRDIRHDQRDLNHDRAQRDRYLDHGRYRAAARVQRDINHDRRDLNNDRRDRNHDVRDLHHDLYR